MSTKLQIVGGLLPQSDWEQTDETQLDYIKNKPKSLSSVYIGSGEMPDGYNVQVDPEGDAFEVYTKKEIDDMLDDINGSVGADGASAYEVAVANGFKGSEIEWLESLQGEDGAKGDKGDKGDAFTFEDFTDEQLEALKGDKGDPGDPFTYEDFTEEQLESFKGEKGESGVYVGTEEPSDDVNVWINPEGVPTEIPESGTNDYAQLENKPKINGVELDGDKTLEALGIPTGGGSGSNAWRKIADLNIAEDCSEVFINQDIDGKPFKAVSYYILLHSAIPTDEAWTAVRAIAVAPWEGVNGIGNHSSIWGNQICTFNPGITNKATAVTSSACYMSVGEGMAFAHMWESYNNGSMPDSLVVPQRAISYYFNSKKALANMNKPYSTVLQFNGTQSCFSAGSRLMVWAIDYIGGE